MSSNLKILLFLLSISFFVGCIKDVDLNLDSKNQKIVMNCILKTGQDTITAWLTKSKVSSSTTIFEAVENAKIVLSENGNQVGIFTWKDSSAYILPFIPKSGNSYLLEAQLGLTKIWGETTIPVYADALIKKASDVGNLESFTIDLKDNKTERNYYWISATGYEGISSNRKQNIACILNSNFFYADDFNRYINNNGFYKFDYDYYLRCTDLQLPEQTSLTFKPQCIKYPITVYLISADYNLDKFMKSSLLMERMDVFAEDMPIIYSPQLIYSNINGGSGIFGSCVFISKKFQKN